MTKKRQYLAPMTMVYAVNVLHMMATSDPTAALSNEDEEGDGRYARNDNWSNSGTNVWEGEW